MIIYFYVFVFLKKVNNNIGYYVDSKLTEKNIDEYIISFNKLFYVEDNDRVDIKLVAVNIKQQNKDIFESYTNSYIEIYYVDYLII